MKGNVIAMWIFILTGMFLLLLAINPDLPTGMMEGWNSLVDQIWSPFINSTKVIPAVNSNAS